MAQGKCASELQVAARVSQSGLRVRTVPTRFARISTQFGIDFAIYGGKLYTNQEDNMRATRMASVVSCSALLLSALAAASGGQESTNDRAPTIRVYSTNGSTVLHTTTYVTPVIEVSENAYVFAVSMDLDGQIQVLQPDFPGISVRVQSRKQLKLPSFFTGFGPQNDPSYGYYSTAGYSRYDTRDNGFPDARGTVIALASRAPFNLEKIESNGDWNMSSIRRLIEARGPESAALALAKYLGAKDEPIGWDFMRFAGGPNYNNAYAYGSYNSCDLYGFSYAPTLASRYFQVSNVISALRQRGQRAAVGYDLCGFPYVIVRGSTVAGGFPRPPRNPGDTGTVFPKSRTPHGTPRHPPLESGLKTAPQGIFPLPQREGHVGDVTITAPKGRRGEPGTIIQGYRPSPVGSVPQGRAPIERVTTPRMEPTTSTGTQQTVRESRPETRSAPPPPPSRVPDATPRYSPPPSPPAPVVREAPSSPPPARSQPLQPAPSRRP
jgi:hypothetical protein